MAMPRKILISISRYLRCILGSFWERFIVPQQQPFSLEMIEVDCFLRHPQYIRIRFDMSGALENFFDNIAYIFGPFHLAPWYWKIGGQSADYLGNQGQRLV